MDDVAINNELVKVNTRIDELSDCNRRLSTALNTLELEHEQLIQALIWLGNVSNDETKFVDSELFRVESEYYVSAFNLYNNQSKIELLMSAQERYEGELQDRSRLDDPYALPAEPVVTV